MKSFKNYLIDLNLANNTIYTYINAIKNYFESYNEFNKKNLSNWKIYLIENFKAKTVNLKIQAINKYLEFIKKKNLKIKSIKIQQQTFLERKLKNENNKEWYFIVWFLGATGARISELIKIKVEHVEFGYIDIYTKGGKSRRIYIPIILKKEVMIWIKEVLKINSGYITTRGISQQLKNFATKYGIDQKVVYPHSFRHRYAKNFLEKYNDISLLADLLGHESIQTTRIYLRKTANEQQEIVDKIVTW